MKRYFPFLWLFVFFSCLQCNQRKETKETSNVENSVKILNKYLNKKIYDYIQYLPITKMENEGNANTIIVDINEIKNYYYIQLYNDSPCFYKDIVGKNIYLDSIDVFFIYPKYRENNPFIRVIHDFKNPCEDFSKSVGLHDLPYPAPWRFEFKKDSLINKELPEYFQK